MSNYVSRVFDPSGRLVFSYPQTLGGALDNADAAARLALECAVEDGLVKSEDLEHCRVVVEAEARAS